MGKQFKCSSTGTAPVLQCSLGVDKNNYNSLSSRFKTVSAVSVEAFQKLNYKCTFYICMSVEWIVENSGGPAV